MGWTEERVILMTKLWQDGLSAAQIAKQLGGCTRNAVIGKVHRLGLAGRAAPSKPARVVSKAPRPARPVYIAPSRPPPAVVVPFPAPALSADELQPIPEDERCDHWCRWPIGDPLRPGFGFCGREQGWVTEARRDPYCPHHRAAERARYALANKGKSKPANSEKELLRSLRRYL